MHERANDLIEDEAVQWPLSRVLTWMQEHGQKIELFWDYEGELWKCLWSTKQTTFEGTGNSPHKATMIALSRYCQPFRSPAQKPNLIDQTNNQQQRTE